MYPPRRQVFRSEMNGRFMVTVLPEHGNTDLWGCYASGATAAEAEEKALKWTWQCVERDAMKGSLSARLGILERELSLLCDALSSR